MINNIGDYYHISSAGTNQVSPDRSTLIRVVINTTSTGTVTIADANTTTTGTTIAVLKASVAEQTFEYGVTMAFGIRIVSTGSSDITAVYRRGA